MVENASTRGWIKEFLRTVPECSEYLKIQQIFEYHSLGIYKLVPVALVSIEEKSFE
jgi:hypothetical protein